MRFYNPGPRGTSPGCERAKDPTVRQFMSKKGTSASRNCVGANGKVSLSVVCKNNGNYSGTKGLGVKIVLFRLGANRFALQFFLRDDSQLGTNCISTTGISGLTSLLAGKAALNPHFYLKIGDTTDQSQDAGTGASNAVFMTIK